MKGVVVSCSYSFDSSEHLHDFVNGTGQDTNAANKLPALDRLEAGREKLAGRRAGSSAGQAVRVREGGARGVCRVAGGRPETETDPGQAQAERGERGRQPDSRQGPATGQGWILT